MTLSVYCIQYSTPPQYWVQLLSGVATLNLSPSLAPVPGVLLSAWSDVATLCCDFRSSTFSNISFLRFWISYTCSTSINIIMSRSARHYEKQILSHIIYIYVADRAVRLLYSVFNSSTVLSPTVIRSRNSESLSISCPCAWPMCCWALDLMWRPCVVTSGQVLLVTFHL